MSWHIMGHTLVPRSVVRRLAGRIPARLGLRPAASVWCLHRSCERILRGALEAPTTSAHVCREHGPNESLW